MTHKLKFGWLSPVIGNRWSDHQPIVVHQAEHILPTATQHFDSLWIADHFYGFDAKTDPFMEGWTTLTWLACLLYTSPSPRDATLSRMPSSA